MLDVFTGIMFGLTEETHTYGTCGLVRINVVVGCASMVPRRLSAADVTTTCTSPGEGSFQTSDPRAGEKRHLRCEERSSDRGGSTI